MTDNKENEIITVKYESKEFIITATETEPDSNLFDYTVYSKELQEEKVFNNQAIFKKHKNNNSEFAQYTLNLLKGDTETQRINFNQALTKLNISYIEQRKAYNRDTFIQFGCAKCRLPISQYQTNINYEYVEKDSKGEIKVDEEGETIKDTFPMFRGYFKSINYNVDNLELMNPYHELTYFNNDTGKEIIFRGSLKEIGKQLEPFTVYYEQESDIRKTVSAFLDACSKYDVYQINHYYSINGYFIHDEKFINNNDYLIDKYKKLSEVEIKEELQKVTANLKNYLNTIHSEFTKICKIILIMPYYYIFKQLGYQEGIKYLYLYGKQGRGKTTTVKNFLSFYNPKTGVYSGAGSNASLRNELNNYDTMPLLIDEAKDLVGTGQELLKDARYNINIKGVANLDFQGKNKEYKAFHHYIFTTNQTNNIFEGLSRGILTYRFDNEKNTNYNKAFDNQDFSIIGYVFSKVFEEVVNLKGIDYILNFNEANDLINDLLFRVEETYDIDLSILKSVNPYINDNKEVFYNAVEVLLKTLRKDYNNYIKKPINNLTGVEGLIRYSEDYLDFKLTTNDEYVYINYGKLNKFLMEKSKKNVFNLKDVLKEVLEEDYKGIKRISSAKDLNGAGVYHTNGTVKVDGIAVSPNAYVIAIDILERLFNI